MGRDKDWAPPSADELRALYVVEGVQRRAGLVADVEAVEQAGLSRGFVWTLGVLWLVALAMLALNFVPRHAAAPAVFYGSLGAGGSVCTDMKLDGTGAWACEGWTANRSKLPVAQPASYSGQCAHVRLDQKAGAWICVGG
jgi:hypothetical protein